MNDPLPASEFFDRFFRGVLILGIASLISVLAFILVAAYVLLSLV